MRGTALIAIVFVAGLGIGHIAGGALQPQQMPTNQADLAGIEKANQADIDATLTQDPKKLMDLWAEDAVAFYPGSPPAVGRKAIAAHNEQFRAKNPGLKVLSYTSKYKNVQVENGLACLWFEKDAQYKLSPEAAPISWHAKGLLVLKREGDGVWRGLMIFPQ